MKITYLCGVCAACHLRLKYGVHWSNLLGALAYPMYLTYLRATLV